MNQERLLKVSSVPTFPRSPRSRPRKQPVRVQSRYRRDKLEIKKAVEQLFEAKVKAVTTVNVKGKTKRTMRGLGKRNDWKKAYVTLDAGQEIDFADAE